jgi:single-strand DNA-binding protein
MREAAGLPFGSAHAGTRRGTMVNYVLLVGNLGSDPEVRSVNGRRTVTRLSVATHETSAKPSGEQERWTEWHQVVAWGAVGERAAEGLRKGGRVLVEGRLQTRVWADARGNKHITAEVHANRIECLGGGRTQRDVATGSERLIDEERSQDERGSMQPVSGS